VISDNKCNAERVLKIVDQADGCCLSEAEFRSHTPQRSESLQSFKHLKMADPQPRERDALCIAMAWNHGSWVQGLIPR
jgi:hypothetical protein